MTALSEFALVWMGAVVTGLAIIAFGTGIERLRPAQPQTLSDTLLNAKYLFPLHAAQLLIVPAIIAIMAPAIAAAGGGWIVLPSTGAGLIIGIAAYLFAMDCGEYWFHRAQHKLPFLWALHSLHHSDERLNVSTTHRHFWGDVALKSVTIYPLVLVVMKPSPAIIAAYTIFSYYNYFLHANIRFGMGRWSWLVNTPQYHRLHHSSREQDRDKRYASLFTIFDLAFGSYAEPVRNDYPPTGLDDGDTARNVAEAAFWPLRFVWR
jgi:sterol desaturase/sphingolipid hydroxylase (fatty acid hydroxylase superfamily)